MISLGFVVLLAAGPAWAHFTGRVLDAADQTPVEGALVRAQATDGWTISDADGNFHIHSELGLSGKITAAKKGCFNGVVEVITTATGLEILLEKVPDDDEPSYEFKDPSFCASCHPAQVDDWSRSAMAHSGANLWVHDTYDGSGTDGGMGGFVYVRDSMHASHMPASECCSSWGSAAGGHDRDHAGAGRDRLSPRAMKRTHLLALATWFATFLLVLAGGVVHATGSSLACPDWPTCFGSFFPTMIGGVLFEHGHRILGTLVGALTVVLAISLRRREGWIAIGLVITQGVLGGLTVIFRLPVAVSTLHLAVSQAFLVLLAWIAFSTRPGRRAWGYDRAAATLAFIVYGQLVVGALVRHTGSGLACGTDFPMCGSTGLPLEPHRLLHMFHRALAIPIGLGAVGMVRRGGVLALALPTLVLIQIGLGLASVQTLLGVEAVTAHLGTGALLLNALALLSWQEPRREPVLATA